MDDFRASSELCEAHGFPDQARLFRALSGGVHLAYILVGCEEGFDVEDRPREGGEPKLIYFDRDEADREAERRNLRAFREVDLLNIYGISEHAPAELSRMIGEILGRDYTFPTPPADLPIFPPSATDEQMRRIMLLFAVRFFYVAETTLVA